MLGWEAEMSFKENKRRLTSHTHVSWTAAFFWDSQFICLGKSQEEQLLTTLHQLEKRDISFWKVNPGIWCLVVEFLTVSQSSFNPRYNFIKSLCFKLSVCKLQWDEILFSPNLPVSFLCGSNELEISNSLGIGVVYNIIFGLWISDNWYFLMGHTIEDMKS